MKRGIFIHSFAPIVPCVIGKSLSDKSHKRSICLHGIRPSSEDEVTKVSPRLSFFLERWIKVGYKMFDMIRDGMKKRN